MKINTQKLLNNPWVLTLYAGSTAFFTYIAFYPFRRAYTAANYIDNHLLNIDYKVWLITMQVLGFAVSKGIGVKIVSELQAKKRTRSLLLFVGISWFFYLCFALIPAPYNLPFMFLASLPLGMVYGVILSILEGRVITEILVAILTASFIVGSGFAKSVGGFVLNTLHFSVFWMPFISASLMLLPFAGWVGLMAYIPAPNGNDIANRSIRMPMTSGKRKNFVKKYFYGVVTFTLSYVMLTSFREFRDNFAPEIWMQLGYGNDISLFTKTELPIALTVLLLMAAMQRIKNNYMAFIVIQGIMLLGGLLIGLSTLFFQLNYINAFWWLTLTGMGGYFAYSMSNSLYFERFLATFKQAGTIGFLITLADYYAYIGSIGVLFYKNFFFSKINHLQFFQGFTYFISLIYSLLVIVNFFYHEKLLKNKKGTT